MAAQSTPAGNGPSLASGEEDSTRPGWLWKESFGGNTDSSATVMSMTSRLGYNFTHHFGVDLGVPIYFVKASSTVGKQTNNGIGNVSLDGRLMLPNPSVNYFSTLTVQAPTGDPAKGLSSGRPTADWDNRFDHSFDRFTPFADVGLGNSIPDSHFFRRPFTTLGFESHFEAGGDFDLMRYLSVGASGYAIVPAGTQKVFSKLVKRGGTGGGGGHNRVYETNAETVGGASIARDDGFNAWADLSLKKAAVFEFGYSRSQRLDLNSVFFSVTFDLSSLINHGTTR